jgi:hypothetical protein
MEDEQKSTGDPVESGALEGESGERPPTTEEPAEGGALDGDS